MHQYLLSVVLTVFVGTVLSAQLTFDKILEIGERVRSDTTLYHSIERRFAEGDTTLALEDLQTLYYGSSFLPDYDPYREASIIEAADAMSRRNQHYESMALLENFLKKNPASLRALLDKAYLSWVINDSLHTQMNYYRYFRLLQVPLQSGDGKSFETAFILRSEQDEELVLDRLNYIGLSESLVTNNGLYYHIVTAAEDDDLDKRRNFYFLIELPLRYGKQKNVEKPSDGN